ncbi:unnamed protein product [Dibothriocephalus latus]|uniref:Uncharacterized protein n=1 Tax=Dibothriocephalus latus TaxID=60516 RepID=A0A3P6TM86_DIBLA|nr:unnamed protein product [Dibothriocephalus latus]
MPHSLWIMLATENRSFFSLTFLRQFGPQLLPSPLREFVVEVLEDRRITRTKLEELWHSVVRPSVAFADYDIADSR